MVKFLFWNVNRNDSFLEVLPEICAEREVDVVALAELANDPAAVVLSLNKKCTRVYHIPFNLSAKLHFFTSYPVGSFSSLLDEGGLSIREVSPPIGPKLLMCALHLPSKLHATSEDQAMMARIAVQQILRVEERVNHKSTFVIGDFNMNPFEVGMVGADAFHSVMDRRVALKVDREHFGVKREFFYNPMWSKLGDFGGGPPGTYYYSSGGVCYFWNCFDQVLIRPSLLRYFSDDCVDVISKTSSRSLLRGGAIDGSVSDHLPIMLRLDIEGSGL